MNEQHFVKPWRAELVNDDLGYHVVDRWGTEATIVGGPPFDWFTKDKTAAAATADHWNAQECRCAFCTEALCR